MKRKFTSDIKEIVPKIPKENFDHFFYLIEVEFSIKEKSFLNAMDIFEILSRILGKENPNFDFVNSLNSNNYYLTYFIIRSKESKHVILEHISTKKRINLLKSTYPNLDELEVGGIVKMGVFNINNDWHFCGVSTVLNFDKNDLDKIKTDDETKVFLFNEVDKKRNRKELLKQHKAFNQFFEQVMLFCYPDEVERYCKAFFIDYNNEKAKSSKEELTKVNNEFLKDKSFSNKNLNLKEDACIYMNPKSGIEIYSEIASGIPAKNNKFFIKTENQDLTNLLLNDFYSTEFFNATIDLIFAQKNDFQGWKQYTRNDFDFIKRFYASNSYETKSRLKEV